MNVVTCDNNLDTRIVKKSCGMVIWFELWNCYTYDEKLLI